MEWIALEIIIALCLVGGVVVWVFLPQKKGAAKKAAPERNRLGGEERGEKTDGF